MIVGLAALLLAIGWLWWSLIYPFWLETRRDEAAQARRAVWDAIEALYNAKIDQAVLRRDMERVNELRRELFDARVAQAQRVLEEAEGR